MSGDYYNMNIQGVDDDRRAQIEAEAVPVFMEFFGDSLEYYQSDNPSMDDIFEGEMRFDHEEFAALTTRWPDAIFRLGWAGDDEGGWPAAMWIKNGQMLYYWDSCVEMPTECPGEKAGDAASASERARAVKSALCEFLGLFRGYDCEIVMDASEVGVESSMMAALDVLDDNYDFIAEALDSIAEGK